jgi:type I restriction enzyme M protein
MAKKKEAQEESLEKQLWKSADKLRKNIDAAEYKHVVLLVVVFALYPVFYYWW